MSLHFFKFSLALISNSALADNGARTTEKVYPAEILYRHYYYYYYGIKTIQAMQQNSYLCLHDFLWRYKLEAEDMMIPFTYKCSHFNIPLK